METLWVTSCAQDMWDASAKTLVRSFLDTRTDGDLLVCHEGMLMGTPKDESRIKTHNLDTNEFLKTWLQTHGDFIPETLGGKAKEPLCKCPGGPHDVHSKKHRQPCLGHWFNKNHSRWFRKIASLKSAFEGDFYSSADKDYDTIIWIDADCEFKTRATYRNMLGWFKGRNAVFYCKHTRPVMEAGVVGYQLRHGGDNVIRRLIEIYSTGEYRNLLRWDDSYVIQKVLASSGVRHVDLAYAVGDHAAVVEHSALGLFIKHAKGRHGRGMGLMT